MSLLLLLAPAALCIDHVHDGDTFTLCGGEKIRIADIDAPELPGSPKCGKRPRGWCDFALGYRSRDALSAFLTSGPVTIDRRAKDTYGRTLAIVTVNGQSAGTYLIGLGLARRWR
jgi:micrococcal nuclease